MVPIACDTPTCVRHLPAVQEVIASVRGYVGHGTVLTPSCFAGTTDSRTRHKNIVNPEHHDDMRDTKHVFGIDLLNFVLLDYVCLLVTLSEWVKVGRWVCFRKGVPVVMDMFFPFRSPVSSVVSPSTPLGSLAAPLLVRSMVVPPAHRGGGPW